MDPQTTASPPQPPSVPVPTPPVVTASPNQTDLPAEIKKWNWGAFLLNWIWGIGNGVWIGLLAFVPFVGFAMPFVLGAKGNEWAWKAKKWDSVEHFNKVQRRWAIAGVIMLIVFFMLGLFFSLTVAAQQSISDKAREIELKNQQLQR